MGVSGCLMALLSACQTRSPETAAISSARSSDTLKILSWQAPTILNPHLSTGFKDAEASRITLEPLASVSATGQLVPILAAAIPSLENGGLTAQGDTVIWKLKPGLQWSDGKPVTADDVV
ncbi:MAG: peptide ABC transporter substrate-binding protein, partial [Microcystaceae cyanobacterium]